MERWFTRKYQLPANHDLFVSRTEAEWQIEMYEDLLSQRQGYRDRLAALDRAKSSAATYAQRNALLEAINEINRVFGDPVEEDDPVIAEWERAVQEGRDPDFTSRKRGAYGQQ